MELLPEVGRPWRVSTKNGLDSSFDIGHVDFGIRDGTHTPTTVGVRVVPAALDGNG